jgi:hypothetical protein
LTENPGLSTPSNTRTSTLTPQRNTRPPNPVQAYFASAEEYLRDHAAASGGLPDLNGFRRWAVTRLAGLAGYEGVPPPAVRELDAAAAAVGGGH